MFLSLRCIPRRLPRRYDGDRSGRVIKMNLKREDGNTWVNWIESLLGQNEHRSCGVSTVIDKPLFSVRTVTAAALEFDNVACLCRVCVCVCVYRRLKYSSMYNFVCF